MGASYWIVVDENGKQLDNVVYIDREAGVLRTKRLNLASTRTNKFYRLRQGRTGLKKLRGGHDHDPVLA